MFKSISYMLLLLIVFNLSAINPTAAQPLACDPEPALRVIATAADMWYVTTMSGNGRYVAYASYSDAIVPDDTNEAYDIFVYDRLDCSTRRVSVSTGGIEGNGESYPSKFSEDGRYLLLYSNATNFHPDYVTDSLASQGIFLLDLQTQAYQYIGLYTNLPGDMSADGRYVVFLSIENIDPSDTNNIDDLYLYDRDTGSYQRITAGFEADPGRHYYLPGISADGAYIAFSTGASLVIQDTNRYEDIYLYERATGNLELISASPQGTASDDGSVDWPSLSADGRYIAFQSFAGNLVSNHIDHIDGYYQTNDVFLYDRISDEIICISVNEVGECGNYGNAQFYKTSLSADGRYILYQWIYFDNTAAFLIYDQESGETKRISVTEDGQPMEVDTSFTPMKTQYLSNDGRFAIFFGDDGLYLTDWQQLLQLPVSEPDAAPVRNSFDESAPILTWSGVDWAAGYQIQIDDSATFSSPDFTAEVESDVLEITLLEDDLAYGAYFWRVRAQRENGTWGNWSTVDEFAYRIYEWDLE